MSEEINLDLHNVIESILSGNLIPQPTVLQIFKMVSEIFDAEPNLLILDSPICVCGDTHGQLYDVISLFEKFGNPGDTRYIFTGDYVDRGAYSIELLCLYLSYKILFPGHIYLLRGNHETAAVNIEYGFHDEILSKYHGDDTIWKAANSLFQLLPVASLIDESYFLVHGGIYPKFKNITEINNINRRCEPSLDSLLAQILWSDPSEMHTVSCRSQRRTGYYFCENDAKEFVANNHIKAIVRSHELVDGYQMLFNGIVITIWSAPNYCNVCNNIAAVMMISPNEPPKFKQFDPMPESRKKPPVCHDLSYIVSSI